MNKKICIVYTHHKLGDLIWQLPYIKAISQHHNEKIDLIVRKKFRGQGIGKKLYKKFIEIASQEGVRRAEWVALDWNVNAIKFYENSGAKILNDWKTIQIDKKSIKNYLTKK